MNEGKSGAVDRTLRQGQGKGWGEGRRDEAAGRLQRLGEACVIQRSLTSIHLPVELRSLKPVWIKDTNSLLYYLAPTSPEH